jgi:hypothetical protein
MWPIQLTAGLIGISLLGAQAPLSTFAGTDPINGYGLGLDASDISILIGAYLVSMIVGALLFPLMSKWTSPRIAIIIAAFSVAVGYSLFLPLHDTTEQVIINMCIAGLGSGDLVGALPAAAAAAAPKGQTGIASAQTNTTKTIEALCVRSARCRALLGSSDQITTASSPEWLLDGVGDRGCGASWPPRCLLRTKTRLASSQFRPSRRFLPRTGVSMQIQ